MNSSIIILFALCAIITIATGQYYRNSDDLTGRSPYYRERHEQPLRDHMRTGIQNNYDRERRQNEHNEAVGPVHTFVKTDEHAHFKWGVRHHVG